MKPDFHPCVVVPVYNHPATLAALVAAVRHLGIAMIMVDDGSNETCKQELKRLASIAPEVILLTLEVNQGKGGAVKAGLCRALELGFTHAVQIDADGQHDTNDIPAFLDCAKKASSTLIAGMPAYDASVPKHRYYCRYITHVWVWINTLSFHIKDSMCGFRVYPLKQAVALINRVYIGNRMDFDTEFMVRWWWAGGAIQQRKTSVRYPADGLSHFNQLRDNWMISKMHARLFFGMLLRFPMLVLREPGKGLSHHGGA